MGITQFFTLNPTTPTALAVPNPQRRELRISNNDAINSVAIAHGTNNAATANHHVIPPGGTFTLGVRAIGLAAGMPKVQTSRCPWLRDVSAVAVSGTPTIAFTEV